MPPNRSNLFAAKAPWRMYSISASVQLPGRNVSSAPDGFTVAAHRESAAHWSGSEMRMKRARFQV